MRSPEMGRHEAGDIVGGWLLRLALIMSVLGFIGYEGIATAVTAVTLDGASRDVARAASTAYRDSFENEEAARDAAQLQARASGVTVVDLQIEDDIMIVQVSDVAPTIIIHDISFFENMTHPHATARHKWRI